MEFQKQLLGENADKCLLQGDVLLIWDNGPWHPHTKQEIYALILVCKHLGYQLPIHVLETVAHWIRLVDLLKDLHNETLEIYIIPLTRLETRPRPNIRVQSYWDTYTDVKTYEKVLLKRYWKHYKVKLESGWGITRDYASEIEQYVAKYDRYRYLLQHRDEWLSLSEKFKLLAN